MFNFKYKIQAFLLSILCLGFASCEDLLDPEYKQYIETKDNPGRDFFECEALLMGVYDEFQPSGYYGRNMIVYPELLGENCKSTRLQTVSDNKKNAHVIIWEYCYSAINCANNLIAKDTIIDAPKATLNVLKGEALFLRALAYFDLARCYSREGTTIAPFINDFNECVPIVLKPTKLETLSNDMLLFPKRATVDEVYKQIIADLDLAYEYLTIDNLLEIQDVDGAKGRVSKDAIDALKTRVYLYRADWSKVIEFGSKLINETGSELADDYNQVFKQGTGIETIFEFAYNKDEALLVSSIDALSRKKSDGGYGDLVSSIGSVYSKYAGDERKKIMEGASPRKFAGRNGIIGADNIPVIRYSEIYLNMAEAYYQLGQEEKAVNIIEMMQIKRKVKDRYLITFVHNIPAQEIDETTGENLLKAILRERRIELAFEGHNFFDLKRRGLEVNKRRNNKDFIVGYKDIRFVAPIDASELQVNTNLKNNPGY